MIRQLWTQTHLRSAYPDIIDVNDRHEKQRSPATEVMLPIE